ncbi:MAG: putative lipid II flippase FtsW [Patescibacteria group bacterium]
MRKIRLKKQTKFIDKTLFILALAFTGFGLVAVAAASAPIAVSTFSDKFYFVKQQAVWGVIGILLLVIFSRVHYSFWEKAAVPLFFISLAALILVLIPGFGTRVLGARRWLILGPISIQPSEYVKLALSIYLAKAVSKEKGLLAYFLPIGIAALLIMIQPDLGTTVVIVLIGFSQVFMAGVSILKLLAVSAVTTALGFLLIITSEYRKSRLFTFLEQTQDPLGEGYHIRQVLLALGSGGLLGVGLGQSRQKYLFLPEAATDSIFAVIAEEAGFVGGSLLIVLFGYFIYRGLRIINNAPDRFSHILATGLVVWIGGQVFLNIGSMVALVPLTGIPLPFFSYGGSSLTSILVATGILLNISRHVAKKKGKKRR